MPRPPRLPTASMDALPDRLAQLGRLHRLFRPEQALRTDSDPEGVTVTSTRRSGPGAGISMRRGRAVTTWTQLDGDSLGYIVEAGDLARRLRARCGWPPSWCRTTARWPWRPAWAQPIRSSRAASATSAAEARSLSVQCSVAASSTAVPGVC
jgi:hypothetical protein